MTSARARLVALVAAALTAALAPLTPASAAPAALPSLDGVASSAPAHASALAASSAPASVAVTRSGRISLSVSTLRDAVARGRVVVRVAKLYRGIRYVAGGTTPRSGFDCSGYTRYVFSRIGIHLPRVSRDQYRWSIHISRSKAVPGDLVFFHSGSGRVYHVAIYAGGGYIWHSPYPGRRVMLERIWTSAIYFGRVRV